MSRPVAACLLALLALGCAPGGAHAHGLEPALLSLRERTPGRFEVVWKSSKIRLPGAEVRPLLPARCVQTADPPRATDDGDRIRLQWTIDCGVDGLAGQAVGVADLDVATIDALLRVELLDGTHVETILTARHPSWTAPLDPTREQLVRHFARLGAERGTTGLDRLLLLAGLLLALAASPRRLVQAALAFALAHTLALTATAVGVVAVPTPVTDLLIAGGVLWVALELTRADAIPRRRRAAWLMGLAFGALTGAACAGTLGDATAAALDAPLALLAFTAGVALPQFAAVLLALALGIVLARRQTRTAVLVRHSAAYAMGVLAVFWCLDRLAS